MKLDVVVPFFNEEAGLTVFAERLTKAFDSCANTSVRFILVDDGSSDRTPEILDGLADMDARIKVIHLWGNHGHQKALIAGLDICDGDAVLMLDGDGQHPVETAVVMVERIEQDPSVDVVQALRQGSQGSSIKNLTSTVFYGIVNLLLGDATLRPGASDFRVIRRRVVDLLKKYPDRHRNIRVLLASLKLSAVYVDYEVADRIAGVSKFKFAQMMRLAADGWFAFSLSPLRVSLLLMLGFGSVGLLYLAYVLIMFVLGMTVPGWTSIMAFMAFLFSAVFGVLAIISEYVARIYTDVRGHPVYREKSE